MIDLYFFPTPNTYKVSIMLEECGLDYTMKPINILEGDQFDPDFLKISPNNRVPAIVDHDAPGGPMALMESGAILIYLAEKTGTFLPADYPARGKVMEWLMWQMGGLGPMSGQYNHFFRTAPEDIPYAKERYRTETLRLWSLLEAQLDGQNWITGTYSIADMACHGWVAAHEFARLTAELDERPNLRAWHDRMLERPAVQRGRALGAEMIANLTALSQEQLDRLYKQKPR